MARPRGPRPVRARNGGSSNLGTVLTQLGGGGCTINPSGGLLSKGHPVGATGVAQLIEIVRQMRGESSNQVDRADVGLAHNVGGTGGVAAITLLAAA